MSSRFEEFSTRAKASQAAADLAEVTLRNALSAKGRASFMVSGGTTPGPMFDQLARVQLAWERVTVGLVDERWVGPESEASNERLVRARLLSGHAGAAGFLPMWVPDAPWPEVARDRSAAYDLHVLPASLILLGMGEDGHTASWFPGAAGLERVLSARGPVAAIDASGCAVASTHARRLTLTGPAIVGADQAILLIFGKTKRAVLDEARTSDPLAKPIRYALEGLDDRLTILWAE